MATTTDERAIFIYKDKKLYGKMQRGMLFLHKDKNEYIEDDGNLRSEILDILPEGIDLQIMLKNFNRENPIELLPYLKNTIGNFDFSTIANKTDFDKSVLSNLKLESTFPNVLDCKINIGSDLLYPSIYGTDTTLERNQILSLSGYQHKLQVSIIDNVIALNYGDFILKPDHKRFLDLAINEHLNVSFMREFGFEVPYNAIVYDEWQWHKHFHYLIKRFDIDENGNKLPQISLNALMKHDNQMKYNGTIEQISEFLSSRLDDTQKMLFLEYIYANVLIYNCDLHKKNIGFVFKDNQLVLSPVYDIINVYAIMLADKLDDIKRTQCFLPIGNHTDGIRISYFEKSAENLGLDFNQVKENLQKIQDIYFEKYPQYIAKMKQISYLRTANEFETLLLKSYNKNVQIAKNTAKNDGEFSTISYKNSAGFDVSNTSGMDRLRDEFETATQSVNKSYSSQCERFRSAIWRNLEKYHNIKGESIDKEKRTEIEAKIDDFFEKSFNLDRVEIMEKSYEFVNGLAQELNINKPNFPRL